MGLLDGQIQQGSEDERMIQRLGGTGGTPRSNFTRLHAGSMSELDPHNPMFAQSPEVSLVQQALDVKSGANTVNQNRIDLDRDEFNAELNPTQKKSTPIQNYDKIVTILGSQYPNVEAAREAAKTNPNARTLIDTLDTLSKNIVNSITGEPIKTSERYGGGEGEEVLSSRTPNISEVIQRATPEQGDNAQPSINPWAVNNPQKFGPFTTGPDTSSNRPKRKLTPNEAKLLNKAKAIFKTDPAKAEELLRKIGR